MSAIDFTPEVCDVPGGCGQTKTYLLPVDHGAADIVRAIANAIRNKKINVIHPRKEMLCKSNMDYDLMIEEGMMTETMWSNLARPRAHGLIAKVRKAHGNWCLTTKGANFLRGDEIPRYAIMSKVEKHQIVYFKPEIYTINIRRVLGIDYWEPVDFTIEEGRIIMDVSEVMASPQRSIFD